MWSEDVEDDLITYIDWHRRHPHCITPRPLNSSQEQLVGEQILDEENPRFFYTKNGHKAREIDPTFQSLPLGKDGDLSTVSVIADEEEHRSHISYITRFDDPWYCMSVKDHLEQSHIDGDSTTVRTKPPKKKKQSDFEREREWAEELFHDYKGGSPSYPPPILDRLEKKALDDKKLLHAEKHKGTVWKEDHAYSKYTAQGTALDAYNKVELHRNVNEALRLYKEEINKLNSPTQSFQEMKAAALSKRILEKEQLAKRVVSSLESQDGVAILRDRIFKTAKDVSRYSRRRKIMIDTSLDALEALEHNRVSKLRYLFENKLCDPNMKTPDEEHIFLYLFQKADKLDVLTSHLEMGNHKEDSLDRKKMQKMLNVFLEFGVDVNTMDSKDRRAAVHLAACSDNCKMIVWLHSCGADMNLLSVRDDMTPLMYAAMFGFVDVAATLLRCGALVNAVNSARQTALHMCGAYGQTLCAKFLLRIGASKRIRDNDGKLAADVAFEK